MRLALRELRRRPGRFAVATAVLSVLAVLLMFLGGLLDGLLANSTGAYRAQRADLFVFSSDSRESLVRSRIDAATRQQITAVPGVEAVGGLTSVQLGARRAADPANRDLIGVNLFGYELAPRGLPEAAPATGQVIADDSAQDEGVREGDVLLLGPQRSPVTVVGFVSDTRYAGQVSLWGSEATWRAVTAANRPDRLLADGSAQILIVRAADPGAVADAVDRATGATTSLTSAAAIESIPGVTQQRSTFNQIIGVTAFIAMIVVALFFVLITIERLGLYGTLKALGGSTRTLFAGVVSQAVVVAVVAWVIATLIAGAMALAIPAGSVPYRLTVTRVVISLVLIVVSAVLGSVFSLRRVVRVDPASAIGASS
ncbi:MAG: FtsX-like permease family protein [Ilumatobacteraceae bacterium]|jgi:putative ABC transport system permease protein